MALFVGTAGITLGGCGGQSNADDVDRSIRELQLAASLREEGNVPGAIEHLQTALELDPENARAELLLAYVHLERGALREAERHTRRGIAILEEREQMRSTLVEAWHVLGIVLQEQGRTDEAIPLLKKSATDVLNTAPYMAWGTLGNVYLEEKQYKKALDALTEAVRTQPRYCVGYYRMGKVHFALENFDEADKVLTQALKADDRCERFFQDAWRLRGETRARLGLADEAILDFERCVELGAETSAGEACQRFLDTTH